MALITWVVEPLISDPLNNGLYTMILRHFFNKNYAKIYNRVPPYKFRLKDFEAFALQKVLLQTGLENHLADALRNGVIAELDQQLPHNSLKEIHATWPAQSASPNFLTEGS